jgi:aryl-alcohol dehydrogenase-like predicted oxidoreductase
MEYRSLGRTGVSVSPLCLGAMMFGPWGNDDRADAIRVVHSALDAGINFVDTADVYSGGVSEEIVGQALQGRRDDVVLATKFFMPMDDRPNHGGGSRRWIIQEVEASLRRLKTDYIDLYQVHRPSPTTDVEETLGALTELSGGWLTGRWRKDAPGTPASAARPSARFDMSTAANQRKLGVVEELALLAERSGMTMIELALAWAINHPAVTSAIIGPRTMEQLESQLPSVHLTLDTAILDRIDEFVAPGVTLNADYNSYGAAELTAQARRR